MSLTQILASWPDIVRRLRMAPTPLYLATATGRIARLAPPGRVIPASFHRTPLHAAQPHRDGLLPTLLRGEPIVLTYHGTPVLVLVPGA